MNIQATPVFHKIKGIYDARTHRQIVAMGGSRSSKSWSILQLFVTLLVSRSRLRITVWRNLKNVCRSTVMKDFQNILYSDFGIYNAFIENKLEGKFTCKLTGSEIIFEGSDSVGKVLGMTQHISFFNEVTEFNEDVYLQITQRTSESIFADYNPSKNFWFERFRKDRRTIFTHSTYLDNPFCPNEIVIQLNSYNPHIKENVEAGTANKYMYEVYCLGIRAEKPNKIYHGWKTIPDDFYDKIPADSFYGLDFGLSKPNALVEVKWDGRRALYVRELLYASTYSLGCNVSEAIHKKFPNIKNNGHILVGDSAKETIIEGLKADGFSAVGALKGAGSIINGITFLQTMQVYYTVGSRNLEHEYDMYSFELDKFGKALDAPMVNQDDHLLDALRYCASYMRNMLGIITESK